MADLRDVSVSEARTLLGQGALLLDVREDNEWEAGHAPDARHVALSCVPDETGSLDKDQLIISVCRSGGRSARAAQYLLEQGFDAVNLEGGMLAWEVAGEPLVGDNAEPSII